jgi:hypothetical protein
MEDPGRKECDAERQYEHGHDKDYRDAEAASPCEQPRYEETNRQDPAGGGAYA